jgi:hypothetical protein
VAGHRCDGLGAESDKIVAGELLRLGDRDAGRAERGVEQPEPSAGFEPIAGAVAVIDGKVDRCTVNGEQVTPQSAASTAAR